MSANRTSLNVSLTPELGRFVADRVASGQYQTASEVVREALRLLVRADGGGAPGPTNPARRSPKPRPDNGVSGVRKRQ